nr:MAG TPA_asm: hypothetical protein [Caudoviricetes sp.]
MAIQIQFVASCEPDILPPFLLRFSVSPIKLTAAFTSFRI